MNEQLAAIKEFFTSWGLDVEKLGQYIPAAVYARMLKDAEAHYNTVHFPELIKEVVCLAGDLYCFKPNPGFWTWEDIFAAWKKLNSKLKTYKVVLMCQRPGYKTIQVQARNDEEVETAVFDGGYFDDNDDNYKGFKFDDTGDFGVEILEYEPVDDKESP